MYNPIALGATNGDNEELNSLSTKKRRKRDPIIDSIRKDENVPLALVESLTTFLLRPVSLGAVENTIIAIPLNYIASIILSVLGPSIHYMDSIGFVQRYLCCIG